MMLGLDAGDDWAVSARSDEDQMHRLIGLLNLAESTSMCRAHLWTHTGAGPRVRACALSRQALGAKEETGSTVGCASLP